jgi:hypothetical protein
MTNFTGHIWSISHTLCVLTENVYFLWQMKIYLISVACLSIILHGMTDKIVVTTERFKRMEPHRRMQHRIKKNKYPHKRKEEEETRYPDRVVPSMMGPQLAANVRFGLTRILSWFVSDQQ